MLNAGQERRKLISTDSEYFSLHMDIVKTGFARVSEEDDKKRLIRP